MTWEIFLGIVALVGFFITVGTPVLKLNTSIIKLNESVNVLRDSIVRAEQDNKEAHKRIHEELNDHTLRLNAHDDRLTKTEMLTERNIERIKNLEKLTSTNEHDIIHMMEREKNNM